MADHSYIKCLKCNTLNPNVDYCTNCGEIINIVLKRQIENEKRLQIKIHEKNIKSPDKIAAFLQKAAEHPNIIVRWFIGAAQSIWTFLALVIGALISMVIAIAAG